MRWWEGPRTPTAGDCHRRLHIDQTINLHEVFYTAGGEEVVGVRPIAARGYPEHGDH